MVHRREINNEVLILGNQGALFGNAMTWWDHSTGSVWSQPLGEAIAGPRKGERLDVLPVEFTTWGAWKEAHPGTRALQADGKPSRFALREMLIVLDGDEEASGYPVPEVQAQGVINDVVDGIPVAIVSDPTNDQRWAVFARTLRSTSDTGDTGDTDRAVVELRVDGAVLRDVATGSTFDPVRGFGLSGPLAGQSLDLLPGFTSFPDDFERFWPGGLIWTSE